MDLKQLRCFLALAEELHFQRAARRLNLTQPALSYQIKKLEEDLGLSLVARDRRSVALTSAGSVLYEGGRDVIARVESVIEAARSAAGQEPQRLRIGFIGYLNLSVIAKSIMAMKMAYPDIKIEQHEIATDRMFDAVREKQIDIGFAPLPATAPQLVVRRVAAGQWCLVMPAAHPFARESEIPLSSLRDLPLVLFDKALNPALYGWWMKTFEAAGIHPKIVLETKQVQTALRMAAEGAAFYIVASYIVADLPLGLAKVTLTGFDNAIAIGAVWHEDNRSKALQVYLKELRKLTPFAKSPSPRR